MPCSRLRHRGFKHCQGHGRGLPCKRCMLGTMTIPELLNHSNWCRATPPHHNNCETYRRECIRSFSDDDPERFETPNDAHDDGSECAEVGNVFVRECVYPPPCKSPLPPPCQTPPLPCQMPPPHVRPLTCQTPLPTEKPPPCKTSPALPSTIIQRDDSYKEIPCPNSNPAGQHNSDKVCKKPSLCSAPSLCKALSSSQIPSPCATMPSLECQSVVICDPDENKIGRRVSFGSVSELRIPPCQQEDSCVVEPVSTIEISPYPVESTQISSKQSFATQNDVCPTYSVESQSDHSVCKKGSTASMEMHAQMSSGSSISCGAENCPKSITAKSKHCTHSKVKQEKEKKAIESCGAIDCPKSTSTINSFPCVSPSPSKIKCECPKHKKTETNECPSASNEMRSRSLSLNSDVTCSHKNEKESESKCNVHKKSNKRNWFRKCKVNTPRKKQQKQKENKSTHGEHCQCNFIPEEQGMQHVEFTLSEQEKPRVITPNGQPVQGESEVNAQHPTCSDKQFVQGYIPQGQNMYSQLPQAGKFPHGQLFTYEQPLKEEFFIPECTLPDLSTSKIQTTRGQLAPSMRMPTCHFGPRGRMPQSQFASGIQTHPGIFSQSPQVPLSNFFAPMPQRQFVSKMQTPPSPFSQSVSVETPRRQCYSQDQFRTQQNLQDQLVSGGQFPQNQFTSGGQIPQDQFAPSGQIPKVNFARSGQTPQVEFPGGYYPRNQYTSDEQNLLSQFNPGQIAQRQFVSGEQYPRSQFAQIPQSEFVPPGHMPLSNLMPGGQNGQFTLGQSPQSEFVAAGRIPQRYFIPGGRNLPGQFVSGQIPQSQFTSAEQFNPFEQVQQGGCVPGVTQNQYIPNDQTLSSHFITDRKIGETFTKEQIVPGQFTAGGQNIVAPYSPDNFSTGKHLPEKPLHLQKKVQYYPGEQGQFAPNGSRLPTQSVSGQIPSGGQMAPSELPQDQIGPQGSNRQKEASQAGVWLDQYDLGNLDKADNGVPRDQNWYGMIHNPQVSGQTPPAEMHQQFQEQFQKHSREQSVSGAQRPPTQVSSGGQMFLSQLSSGSPIPTRISFSGGQVPSNQYTQTELPQNQIGPQGSNRQEVASQVGVPLGQFVRGSLDKVDHGVPRDQNGYGMVHNPRVLGQTPQAEMPQQFQEQFQKQSREQSVSGAQRPPMQVPSGGQMFPTQSGSGSPIPTRTSFSGGQIPLNQYTPAELPQDQISAVISNRQELSSQVGTPPDKFDLMNLDNANQGAPRDQNWHGIICPPIIFGSERKVTTNISPCSSLKTLCKCIKISCNCLTRECRDKFKCTCCCNNNSKAPKHCQYACVQCTEGSKISPTKSVSGDHIQSNPNSSARTPSGQFSSEGTCRNDQGIEAGKPSDQNRLENLDKKETDRICIPCRNAEGNLCNCTDKKCSCPISDKSGKNTGKRTWCLQNVIINTSLHKFQHPNTAPVANTPEVSAILKRSAYCECHYPPMFRHFQCTGNSCGICKCRETQHE